MTAQGKLPSSRTLTLSSTVGSETEIQTETLAVRKASYARRGTDGESVSGQYGRPQQGRTVVGGARRTSGPTPPPSSVRADGLWTKRPGHHGATRPSDTPGAIFEALLLDRDASEPRRSRFAQVDIEDRFIGGGLPSREKLGLATARTANDLMDCV
jgi:hypothetical protein